MSGIVLAADWDDPRPAGALAAAMLARLAHRAAGGTSTLSFPDGAMGAARGARAPSLLHDPELEVAIAADTRLDDREALARALGAAAGSDAELLLAAYARWGVELDRRLTGDFAFVIADARARRVYAARDAFGARPLFFALSRARVLAATEVEPLIAAGARADVDPDLVLEYLLERYTIRERTFFPAIRRVLPGHRVVIEGGVAKDERWFQPPPLVMRLPSYADYTAEVRRRLAASIASRLDAERPVLAHLSGGIDSSSIVCLAASLRARVHAISAVYPGLACDESRFIDAVVAHAAIPAERYDGRTSSFDDYARPPLLHPGRPPTSGTGGEHALARRLGARVLLSGSGGDQLFFERGIYRDLLRSGRLPQLYRELTAEARYGGASPRALAKDAVRGLAPRTLRDAVTRLRRPEPAPPWLGPELQARHAASAANEAGGPALPGRTRLEQAKRAVSAANEAGGPTTPGRTRLELFSSETQAAAWRWLTSAPMVWNVEVQELDAARIGLELRFPFLDARLAELVLAVPWEHRVPRGRMKALLRDALGPLLPELVRERTQVTSFGAAVVEHVRLHRARLDEVLAGAHRAAAYVDLPRVRARVAAAGDDWREASFLWAVVMLELWLERVAEAARGPARQ